MDGKNGIFLGATPLNLILPAGRDTGLRFGFLTAPHRKRINAAGVEAYHAAVEQLVARAQAVRPAPIKEQMAEAAKASGKRKRCPACACQGKGGP